MLIIIRYALFLLITLVSQLALADDPYGSCIKGYDFGGIPIESVVMAPINPDCQSLCANECGSFSRQSSLGVEINNATIINCLSVCQGGNFYTGYYFEDSTDANNVITRSARGPVTTRVSCTGVLAAKSNVYQSTMQIITGDNIQLVVASAANANKIYLCGKKVTSLSAMMKSVNPYDWNKNTPPQTVLASKSGTMCSAMMDSSLWANITNAQLWATYDTSICAWNAKNNLFTDTQIWAKDGDELSISWQSSYVENPSYILDTVTPIATRFTRSNIYKLSKDPNYLGSLISLQYLLNKQSSLSIMLPGGNPYSTNSPFIELNGEGARVFNIGDSYDPSKLEDANLPPGAFFYGLKGTVNDVGYVVTPLTNAPLCDSADKRTQNYQSCGIITDPGFPIYSFSGVLNGFSANPALIALRHWEQSGDASSYADNLGGADVTVQWGGCPFENGQMLQYAIASNQPADDDPTWQDVPAGVFANGDYISAATSGSFYLRIKPLAVPTTVPADQLVYYTDPAHRFGQYYINLSKVSTSNFIQSNGFIKQIVDSVRFALYGDPSQPSQKGIVENLYTSLIQESSVITAIRAVLVLYISLTGLGYLIGTLQMTQQDMIIRLFKFTFVAIVISPMSWDFFANNLFNIFIDGGLELIGKVVTGSLTGNTTQIIDVSNDPSSVFAIFDGPFQMLFSTQTWNKIGALCLTGVFGWILVVLIIISCVYYFLSLAKATLMFLMSMVIIALLLFVAPLFLSFMLFSLTKSLFDNWWKFLISFTLQPVAVFTSIAIFNMLIILALYTALGFTICPSCLFSIVIPGIINFCLINAWQVMAYSHFPDAAPSFFLPIGVLQGTIFMLILAKGMYAFCEFISAVVNRIVSGQVINQSSLTDYGQQAMQSVKSLVGQDNQSVARRKNTGYGNQQTQTTTQRTGRSSGGGGGSSGSGSSGSKNSGKRDGK